MQIKVMVYDENILKAAMIVMKHYNDRAFAGLIFNVEKFNHTEHSPVQVALVIEKVMDSLEVEIHSYKSLNPFSKAVAHVKGNKIYFNERKTASYIDRAGTIIHECFHLVGYQDDGNRVTKYNLQTVPYKVQLLFERYIQGIYG
jgi:hypothetical protein